MIISGDDCQLPSTTISNTLIPYYTFFGIVIAQFSSSKYCIYRNRLSTNLHITLAKSLNVFKKNEAYIVSRKINRKETSTTTSTS